VTVSGRVASRFLALHVLLSTAILFAAAGSAAAQDALTKLRAEYALETNPVDKAKTLAKLSPREMTAVRDFSRAGEDEKALATLEHYRDAVVATTSALIATGVDASRRSGGFKELQISLRMFIRRLDDLILSLQQDSRPSFRAVRADLQMAQNSLIDALFPVRIPKRPTGVNLQ
jgi:hypothetical protein